mgnify:CR=1 FL=1
MTENVIIIPSRLEATRLPNKPMKKINNKEMILHVYEAAIKSKLIEDCLIQDQLVLMICDTSWQIVRSPPNTGAPNGRLT